MLSTYKPLETPCYVKAARYKVHVLYVHIYVKCAKQANKHIYRHRKELPRAGETFGGSWQVTTKGQGTSLRGDENSGS